MITKTVFLALFLVYCGTGGGAVAASQDMEESPKNRSTPVLDGRIVGGLLTRIEAFPYQVSVSYSKAHSCGGSILKSRVVLTAAHCVEDRRPQLIAVRAGSTRNNQGGVVVPIERVIVHPNYNSNTMDSDIALLVLSKELTFSSSISRIAMATLADVLTPTTPLIVSGWGATSEGSRSTTLLRYTQVQLINQQTCSNAYRIGGGVSANMICAGDSKGGHDSCQGDSGGPLIAYSGTQPKLHGIVSWGYGCARPKYPGVYTKIVNMNGWVQRSLMALGFW